MEIRERFENSSTLAEAIRASGLSKTMIADLAGIHPAALSHILSGRREPTVSQKVGLSKALGRRIAELFGPVTVGCRGDSERRLAP